MRTSALGLAIVLWLSAPAAASGQGEPTGIGVPGGFAPFARALGASEDLPRARLLTTAIRILWEVPEGVDPAVDRRRAGVFEYLRALDERGLESIPAGGDEVPGFLPASVWPRVLATAGATGRSPFTAILCNRRVALFYLGVASLDRVTRDYLVARPTLLAQVLAESRVALFATFGRSLRIGGDAVLPPGGNDAAPLWEAVAGASLADPAAFVPIVLERDGGRLALLYDGIAHLDERARRFALGLQLPAGTRVERFRAFYAAAGAALHSWQPQLRPFERVPYDAVHLLLSTRFDAAGHLAGPASPILWHVVFDPSFVPGTAAVPPTAAGGGDSCDAARMLELVGVRNPVEREQRSRAWLFAQRVFQTPTPGSGPDLVIVLKAVPRYPSLFVALERMGIDSPGTYAAASARPSGCRARTGASGSSRPPCP